MADISLVDLVDKVEAYVFKRHSEAYISWDGRAVAGYDYESSGWDAWESYGSEDDVLIDGVGMVKVVERFGGEGQGDAYYMVFRVINEDGVKHYKLGGHYASYYGGEYYGEFEEVSPVVREVTFWE